MKRYAAIYADPPWNERGVGIIKRGADRHYPLMKTKDIVGLCSMVREWAADDSMLFLWTTNNFLPDALEVMKAWGFTYKTNWVWCKDRWGLGFYNRGQHELLLFGVRGLPEYARQRTNRRGRNAPPSVIHARRGLHSSKPLMVADMIEKMNSGPYLEMFARTYLRGWDSWGLEAGGGPNTYRALWE